MHIPAHTIGRFQNANQAEAYGQARAIQHEVQSIADLFVRADETPADLNRGRRGEVLLQPTSLASISGDPGHYAQGSLSYNPQTGEVQQLKAEAWHTWARIAHHSVSADPVSLTRQGDCTTYRSLSGSVTVDGQGNTTFNLLQRD